MLSPISRIYFDKQNRETSQMKIGKFNWFYSIKNHEAFSLPSFLQSRKHTFVAQILRKATTNVCRCVICVDKQESFGDIICIFVELNSLYTNYLYRFTRKQKFMKNIDFISLSTR